MSERLSPLISVIVAVYNGKATLQQCIDSVAQQTYPSKELIIIDGGSTDGTIDLINANRKKIAYWVSEPDHGIYNAWNKGMERSKGEWICFLGADDFLWNNQVLERMATHLEKLPSGISVAYGQIMLLSIDGHELHVVGEPWQDVKEQFKQYMSIPHQAVMHRRSLFEQHGKFDESFCIAGDYELLLRELKTGDAVFIPDIVMAGMRAGGISSLSENSMKMLREFGRAQRMHGQPLPGRFVRNTIFLMFAKSLLWAILGDRLARKILDLRRRMRGLPPYWTKI